jgi:hypothetical protein
MRSKPVGVFKSRYGPGNGWRDYLEPFVML